MDLMETESFCSTSSSDLNLPKDYSLSSSDLTVKSDSPEANNNIISKSMKLNFGVDRLLSKCDKKFETNHIIDDMLMNRNLIERSLYSPCANDHEVLLNLSANNAHHQAEIGSNQLGINLLHQQLSHLSNGLSSQGGFVLKPFPIRFGRNHNGFVQQPPSYFQSNFRKVSMTPNMNNVAPPSFAGISPYHHSIMRLPNMAQLSPNNSVTQFYNQQKISKASANEAKAQQNSTANGGSNVKRKRSWSRAVFSNLQRKGLERQFEFQKYITKPDRKKLAARLGLKDAQVKVWFQNRRMKWRHTTRGTTIPTKVTNSSENSELNDEEDNFTSSSSEGEDGDIDVVTDN